MKKSTKIYASLCLFGVAFVMAFSLQTSAADSQNRQAKTDGKLDALLKAMSKKTSGAATKSKVASKASAVKSKTPQRPVRKNPFRFNSPSTDGGFVEGDAEIPAGIKVVGFIVVEGQEPIAAIKLPNSKEPLFVRKGDIVGVEFKKNDAAKSSASARIAYLKIENITAQQVTVAPRDNPAGKQILR